MMRTTGRGKRRVAQMEARPPAEWIEVAVPPLIEAAVWERAQEFLHMNQTFASRNHHHHFYLLRGLLVCGTCGHTLQGRTQNGRVYYHCEHGGKERYPTVAPHRRHLAGHILEPLVWDAIVELLHQPDRIAQVWEAEAAQAQTTPDELGRLQARQRKLEQQWLRLLDAFQEGLLDKAELAQRKQRLDQERQSLTERISQMQRHQAQQAAKTQILDQFAAFCAHAQTALQHPTPEVKQEVLRLLVQCIVVEEDAITIKHIIPTDDNCRLLPRGKPPEKVYSKVGRPIGLSKHLGPAGAFEPKPTLLNPKKHLKPTVLVGNLLPGRQRRAVNQTEDLLPRRKGENWAQ
jgi:site-specific DNA recombinase